MPQYELLIEFESDWHIGQGAGRPGSVDRLVLRDEGGVPYIPAKTITGIWRDACERIAHGLDNGSKGAWSRFVEIVFGDQPALRAREGEHAPAPEAAVLSVRPAEFPKALGLHLANEPRFREAVAFVKPGVKIDRETGQAEDDHLRYEEVVRGGCFLAADVSLSIDHALQPAAEALLFAGAAAVERLGGKRRRGAGRCAFRFLPEKKEEFLRVLGGPPPSAGLGGRKDRSGAYAASRESSEWVSLDIEIKAEAPLVVPKRVIGNVVYSQGDIPGTYLLGPVTRPLMSLIPDLFAYVSRGDLQVLFARPTVAGSRGRPVPFALYYEKEKGGFEKGGEVRNRLRVLAEGKVQLKGYREGFVGPDAGDGVEWFVRPVFAQRTHNTISDEEQRPTEEMGGVYTYEAIPAGKVLQSRIRLSKELADRLKAAETDWWKTIEGPARIGLAKKDDYGLVKIAALGEPRGLSPKPPSVDGELVVWLLSDLLIRDARLRSACRPDDLERLLSRLLGVSLSLRQAEGRISSAGRVSRSDGWHAGWSLPRPSYAGLAAGSCFVFRVDGRPDPDRLARIEREGIGDRRAEGYGEVVFNPPLLARDELCAAVQRSDKDKRPPEIRADAEEYEYARLIEGEVWRGEIQRRADWAGSDNKKRRDCFGWDREGKKPPNSQLGALRSAVSHVRGPEDVGAFSDWLDHLKNVENRKDKWPDGALNKVEGLLTNRAMVWERLEWPKMPTMTEAAEERLKGELWAYAVRALVNASIRGEVRDRERNRQKKRGV